MVLKEWKNDDSDVLRDLYFVYEISTILLPYLLANLCNYTCQSYISSVKSYKYFK